MRVKPKPAANVSRPLLSPTMPSIMSLAFEVEGSVTLTGIVQGVGGKEPQEGFEPPFVAGDDNEGSKGLNVFAPLIPHTTNPMFVDDEVAVTVTVSADTGEEATAHHSPTSPLLVIGANPLNVKLRPLAVGTPLKAAPVDMAKTIITSFELLVENPVTEHDEVGDGQEFEPEPSKANPVL